jgi:hypothetical protein
MKFFVSLHTYDDIIDGIDFYVGKVDLNLTETVILQSLQFYRFGLRLIANIPHFNRTKLEELRVFSFSTFEQFRCSIYLGMLKYARQKAFV